MYDITDAQAETLRRHYELLARWNQVLNLTAVRDEAGMVERHYAESIFLAVHLPVGSLRIADIGSGAGFPGFPVAIVRPECHVTLIESHQRKAVFLKEASREIPNITVLPKRAEEVKEGFDWAISRAVRYQDMQKALRKLSERAALLTGEASGEDLPGYTWNPPIRLPWGENRWLFVSRETGSMIG